jgi:hypothetical protein
MDGLITPKTLPKAPGSGARMFVWQLSSSGNTAPRVTEAVTPRISRDQRTDTDRSVTSVGPEDVDLNYRNVRSESSEEEALPM